MAMRIAVIGVGHELMGDDAAGLAVCRRLEQLAAARLAAPDACSPSEPALLILPVGPAPENCTARLRRFAPDRVVLVDAARLGAAPGSTAWIPWEAAEAVGGSTHTLPLRLLCEYLATGLDCRVELLGIQPAQIDLGSPLSPAVAAAVEAAAQMLLEELAGVTGQPAHAELVSARLHPQEVSV